MEETRYTVKELTDMYNIDSKTLLLWTKNLGFPLFEVSPRKRYARESDLRQWEDSCCTFLFSTSSSVPQLQQSPALIPTGCSRAIVNGWCE